MALLSAIAPLILFMLWLATFQKRSFWKHHPASLLVNWVVPLARWSL